MPDVDPTPLVRLALHVLSICPNSASCERLFSTFGLILTKLRTRLGKQRIVDLAECKMHIRDEHMRNNTKQHLRHRAFGVNAEKSASASGANLPPDTANLGSGGNPPAADSTSNSATNSDPTATDNSDVPAGRETATTRSLRTLTSNLIRLLDEDIDINEGSTTTGSKRTLVDLLIFLQIIGLVFLKEAL